MIWTKENCYSAINTYYTHKSDENSVCYSPCGNFLASGCSDKRIFIHDIKKYVYQQEAFAKESCAAYQVIYSPCGRFLASVGWGPIIRIQVIETKEIFRSFAGHKLRVNSILFLSSGKHLISGSDDQNIRIWDIDSQKEAEIFGNHQRGVTCLSLSHSGVYFSSASSDKTVKMWKFRDEFGPNLKITSYIDFNL
ncbi:unnamed protein product [Blepharisma stoltei]|uniref:Uncharacterized protein n=1 Tax=Blepharisma stoltei TaxID=1481888 RepID=A0AAU9JAH9_9CILI|nr:unnamed protein product [Blepharisma stoltei]